MTLIRKTGLMALLVALSIGLSGCSYNRSSSQEEAIKAQWAQVENQLQRRNDLIPNLVETVKGTAQQEKDVFGQIADSRAKLAGATTPEQRMQAANEQSTALARLLVVVENYPELKSNATVQSADGRTGRHREPARRRAHAVQRTGAGLQHVTPVVPVERHRRHLRLQGTPALQRTARSRARASRQLREQAGVSSRRGCRSSTRCCPSSTTR